VGEAMAWREAVALAEELKPLLQGSGAVAGSPTSVTSIGRASRY
jgi:hypothetical protein